MENKNNENCIFCHSLLFSYIKIENIIHPSITCNCYQGHKKEIDFSIFFEKNNNSFDNNKLKLECPFCKEYLDKDVYFLCVETKQLICPKCIALNIIILSSKTKDTKKKTKTKAKKTNKEQPHYSTLISLLKESNDKPIEKINIDFLNEKEIEEEKKEINSKYNIYKDLIIDEKEQNYLNKIYNFIINLNIIKKRCSEIYKEYKNYLSKYFYENIKYISLFNNIKNIFLNNFLISDSNSTFPCSKELIKPFKLLYNYYKSKSGIDLFVNKLSLINDDKKENKNIIKCIYQKESIISHILYFTFESDLNEKQKYLIVSSNNGIINILETENYKLVYILDIFQKKGIYHLIQCKNEKNTFYASSWGCFKKIKLLKEFNKDLNIETFTHKIIKTYKKSDIIRILKLIEISKNNINKNMQNDIISLDEGGHIIAWGYNEQSKKDIKEEIFVADREDSINNMILFISKKICNILIFTTRNSTLSGSIYFYSIEDGFYELKVLKNKYKSNQIYFDLQYNNLTQINDYMIVFPQNKKLIFIEVKTYQITTIIEMETDLLKDKFYNMYGETIGIINFIDNKKKCFLIFSSKGFIYQYFISDDNEKEIFYIGMYKYNELKEEIEYIMNSSNYNNEYEIDLNKECLYLKLNKKILVIDINKK